MRYLLICLLLVGCVQASADVPEPEDQVVIVIPDPPKPEPKPEPDGAAPEEPPPPPAVDYEDVYVYVSGQCPVCVRMFTDLGVSGDYSKPVIYEGFRFIPVTETPAFVGAFPTIHFKSPTSNTGWRRLVGWESFSKFKQKYDKAQAVQTVEKVPAEPKASSYQLQFGSRSMWTYPGSIQNHLRTTHGFTAGELRGLSRRQMEQLHSNEHERGNPRRSYGRQKRTMSGFYRSYCPTGRCP